VSLDGSGLTGGFRAPLVGSGVSCGDAGPAEHVEYGSVGHAEVFADCGERLAGLIHLPRDCEVVVAEDAIARLHSGPSEEAEGGGSVDAELLGERGRGFTSEVAIEQFGSLRIAQSGLLLAERWDGSMGRSVTALTSEDAAKTRHDVGVGVTRIDYQAVATSLHTRLSQMIAVVDSAFVDTTELILIRYA
jgi:hypothetical protein